MARRHLTTIVLAAGEGTRMKSARPKVLHEVAGLSMLGHVIRAAADSGTNRLAIVVGPGRSDVEEAARAYAASLGLEAAISVQNDRLGTAHAALQAREALLEAKDDLIIAFGDTPLLTAETFNKLREPLTAGAAIAVSAFDAADPTGYGRVLLQDGEIVAIREEKDASPAERHIRLCNGGLMAIRAEQALTLLEQVGNDNAKGEFYLTDIIEIGRRQGLSAKAVIIDENELRGVNTRAQLAETEALMQVRLRKAAMAAGVTLVAPETVFLSYDTKLAADVWIGPHVVLGTGVEIAGPSEILSFSHLAGCKVGANVRLGPFARIRPQTVLGDHVHIGNFVEINRATLGADVQANHLAYVGDAEVGAGSNIGAGTITCNFDGADKHRTRIGRDVFVGSNATLVAPLDIGDEVLIAAGSTVTNNVETGALVFGRARQDDVAGKGAERVKANKAKRAARKAREG